MSVALYKTNRCTEDLNLCINRWLAGGITKAQITTILSNASAAVTASSITAGHDDRLVDSGSALNPTQPRNI